MSHEATNTMTTTKTPTAPDGATTPEAGQSASLRSGDLLAVSHVQHPLTGEAVPVMRLVNDRTTVADLIDWQRRNCTQPDKWDDSWCDVRILPASR